MHGADVTLEVAHVAKGRVALGARVRLEVQVHGADVTLEVARLAKGRVAHGARVRLEVQVHGSDVTLEAVALSPRESRLATRRARGASTACYAAHSSSRRHEQFLAARLLRASHLQCCGKRC